MERHNIAPGFVHDALASIREKGLDPLPLLISAGLPANVSEPVTNQQYGRLWRLLSIELDDEFFGLAARPMRPGSFKLMCHAVLHAGTLERALRRALLFLNVVLDDPRGELRIRNGEAQVVLQDADGPRPAFAYRAYWLILMGVMTWLVGRSIPLRRLDFACASPQNRTDYRQFFGAPVAFECSETSLVFSSAYLSLPLIRNEPALGKFLRDAPANFLVRYRHDHGVSARVRAELNMSTPQEWPSLDATARTLGFSVATLRRQLRAEGQSFSAIKDEMRTARAQGLLREGKKMISEIAVELGYSEPSAFYRAFTKRVGLSPGEYRRLQIAHPASSV